MHSYSAILVQSITVQSAVQLDGLKECLDYLKLSTPGGGVFQPLHPIVFALGIGVKCGNIIIINYIWYVEYTMSKHCCKVRFEYFIVVSMSI